MRIQLIPVENSSNVSALGYHDDAGVVVMFKGQRVYAYPEADVEVLEDALEAESVGSFINRHVVKVMEYEQLDGFLDPSITQDGLRLGITAYETDKLIKNIEFGFGLIAQRESLDLDREHLHIMVTRKLEDEGTRQELREWLASVGGNPDTDLSFRESGDVLQICNVDLFWNVAYDGPQFAKDAAKEAGEAPQESAQEQLPEPMEFTGLFGGSHPDVTEESAEAVVEEEAEVVSLPVIEEADAVADIEWPDKDDQPPLNENVLDDSRGSHPRFQATVTDKSLEGWIKALIVAIAGLERRMSKKEPVFYLPYDAPPEIRRWLIAQGYRLADVEHMPSASNVGIGVRDSYEV